MSDLTITEIGELVTNASGRPGDLGVVRDASVAVRDGRITWTGPGNSIPDEFAAAERLDVDGRSVIPGFVDSHTHLVFAGDRSVEFARRIRGEGYSEILASGGGIHSTVAATREAVFEDLVVGASTRARRMLEMGTTTVEVKSGYGLNVEHEVRMLEAAAAVSASAAVTVVSTFLAHVPDVGVDRAEYLTLLTEGIIPAAAPHARFCDVFCDQGAFTVVEASRILEAGLRMGLESKIHAEQLSRTGAAGLAAEVGAASADHLEQATGEDAAALAAAGVVGVLLPAAALSLGVDRPPARMLWDSGVTLALATDCNPGSAYVESMPLVVALGCLELGLTPEEALWAATAGGAASLRLSDHGRLAEGCVADLVVLDAPSYTHIPYRPGWNPVAMVLKGGERVV